MLLVTPAYTRLRTARDNLTARFALSWARLRGSALPILQCSLAAAMAWALAKYVVGHQVPFFAPTAAVVSIGVSFGARLRRAVELMVGVAVGIGIGDVFIARVGTGVWQLALVVAAAIAVAVFVDGGTVITVQASSSAVLVATLMPPSAGGGFNRMIDALIGGVVGVVVVAAVPLHPLRRARDQTCVIVGVMSRTLADGADGLLEQNAGKIQTALTDARGTQPQLDRLRSTLLGGREISRISPLYWSFRQQLETMLGAIDPLDNAVRNTRVLLRRSLTAVRDDEILSPGLIEVVRDLAEALETVREMVQREWPRDPHAAEPAVRRLREVAKKARPELVQGAGLSAHVVFAQLRSTLVDVLQFCGVDRVTALAVLPPTVPHPYVTPLDG